MHKQINMTACATQVSLAAIVLMFTVVNAAPRLEPFLVDKQKLSVSGLSSGGYFAVQFHVAFSKTIMGAGVVSGGPFWCAQDNLSIALTGCMTSPQLIFVPELVSITYSTALSTTIDHPYNLRDDKVYLFSGMLDSVVVPGVMKKLGEYYSAFVPSHNIYTEMSIPAEHAMVTDSYGNSCKTLGSPFINNCNYSTAYHILQQIYGDIRYTNASTAKDENLMDFDQSEFFLNLPHAVSMDDSGFMYVPTTCQKRLKECRLHIAFHGCLQGRFFVQDAYSRHAGYNEVAEANNIIILYPQAKNSTLNPKGCWDWWGYTSPAYASKLGPQMAGVKMMLDRAAGI